MKIEEISINDVIPYENNPRKNDGAVEAVANSIREFGFRVPIIIDRENVIIAGHTRLKAAEQLGLEKVPVVRADDLTEEQVKAFRLADNKVAELADWDLDLLAEELADISDIDVTDFGFDAPEADWFEQRERNDTSRQEGNEEYNEFLEKFEPKKTTDDCYTPDVVYAAVADWVSAEYGLRKDTFLRPFYPGGDYQKEKYEDGMTVVDNPPFSILAEIIRFYTENGVKFFLFAPTLTLFSANAIRHACAIPTTAQVTYENGAKVNTSFVTNLEPEGLQVRTAPDLYKVVVAADEENRKEQKRELPKYSYPNNVITAPMVGRWCKYGIEYRLNTAESVLIDALDEQKESGKAIYGKGFLISERAAAERAAAERAAAERAAAERAAAERAAAHCWGLSEREKEIIKAMG